MSRTRKDRPWEVRRTAAAKKNGKHSFYCDNHAHSGLNHGSGEYTRVETHIFHAHEIKEMEALQEELAGPGVKFKVSEKSGYLISKAEYTDRFTLDIEMVRDEVVSTLHGSLNGRSASKFNLFFILEVSKTTVYKRDDECCDGVTPAGFETKRGACSCCLPFDRKDTRTKVRSDLTSARKEHYASV